MSPCRKKNYLSDESKSVTRILRIKVCCEHWILKYRSRPNDPKNLGYKTEYTLNLDLTKIT